MKKLFTLFFLFHVITAFSQSQVGINYQSIIRNSGGTVIASSPVIIEFKLYSTATFTNVVLYHESHSTTTNQFGMANVVIGQGTVVGGIVTFTNIPWISGVAYEVYVNSNMVGSREPFVSVPYAFAAAYAPAPSVTYSNNVLSVGGNTVTINNGATYTAGNGIDITGGVISNTAPNQTVTITGANVTGAYPNFTITAPATQTTTLVNGTNITLNQAGNTYTVNAPTYSLSQGANSIDLLQNGASIATATLPTVTNYTAGNGIDITGGVISNTMVAATPTITGTGITTVTSAGNTFTVNTPAYTAGNGIDITAGVISNTQVAVTPTLTVSGNSISINPGNTEALPSYSLSQSGSNIDLLQNGMAIATVTLTASTSTSLSAGNSNITLSQSGNSYTLTPVTPTLDVVGGSLTGAYPTQTLTIPASSVVAGNSNITVASSGNTYSVSAVTPTLTVNGAVLSGSYPTQTLTVPATTLTTLTASTNVVVLGTAPNYTLSSPSQSLTINSNSISITGGNTITIPTSSTTILTGSTNVSVSGTAPNYTVSAPAYSISANNNTVTITNGVSTSSTAVGAPPMSYLTNTTALSSTLTIGTQSIVMNDWSLFGNGSTVPGTHFLGTTDAVSMSFRTNNIPRIGINTSTVVGSGGVVIGGNTTSNSLGRALTLQAALNTSDVSDQTYGHFTIRGGAGVAGQTFMTFANNIGSRLGYFGDFSLTDSDIHLNASNNMRFSVGSYTTTPAIYIDAVNSIVGINNTAPVCTLDVAGNFKLVDGTQGAGKVLTSDAIGKASWQTPLASPWAYNPGVIYPLNNASTDKVAIGSAFANALFDVNNTASSTVSVQPVVNIANSNPAFNALGVLQINKSTGFGALLYASNTYSTGDGLSVSMSNPNNGSNAVQVIQGGIGNAGYFDINNSSNASTAMVARVSNGIGFALQAHHFGTGGTAGEFKVFNTSNPSHAVFSQSAGTGAAGFFEQLNSSAFANAVYAGASGNSAALRAVNTNSTNSAAYAIDANTSFGVVIRAAGSSNNNVIQALNSNSSGGAGAVIYSQNNGTGSAIEAQALQGSALTAVSNSSVSPTIIANNTSTSDAIQAFSAGARALYAQATANGYAGAEIVNNGTGAALIAYKTNGTNGNVATFSNNSTTNGADAMVVQNYGTGSAITAIAGPTVSGSSNVALRVDAGHLKSTQPVAATTSSVSAGGGLSTITLTGTNCTDVKGSLLAVCTTTGMINSGGQVTLRVTFAKSYVNNPTVVITPNTDFGAMTYYISAISPSSFNVTIKNGTLSNISGSSFNFGFNYFVIE